MFEKCFRLLRLMQKESKKLIKFYRSYFILQKSLDQDRAVGTHRR
jgi:hypothetical protein